MSRSIKLIIAGLCFALASTSTASAQMSQMRLFSPFPDDQFGGGAYQREGFYGCIAAGVLSLSQPSDQFVGSEVGTSSKVVTNVFPGQNDATYFNYVAQTNQMNTSQFHATWETATEFTIGNQIGHHGFEVKGTVVSPQNNSYEGVYGGINIEDPAVVDVSSYGTNGNYYIWTGNGAQPIQQLNTGATYQIGRLWALRSLDNTGTSGQGYVRTSTQGAASSDSSEQDRYVFVPMPITFETFSMQSQVDTWSVEAMYNYRFHPFRRGTLEALAGIRYTQFDGEFRFFGHANTKNTSSYTVTEVTVMNNSNVTAGTTAVTTNSQNFSSQDYSGSNTIGSDLGYSDWNFDAQNHIVGPQVGARYTISNDRWRFIGEAKYFAGFNRQNIYGDGTLGLKAMSDGDTQLDLSSTGGVPTYAPLNTIANTFAYSKHFDAYSNGVDGKIEAAWNWTQAVGLKVGYQMLYMDNIARASAVNNYRLNEDGSIFGVKENKKDRNFDQFVHGVMFTVMVNR